MTQAVSRCRAAAAASSLLLSLGAFRRRNQPLQPAFFLAGRPIAGGGATCRAGAAVKNEAGL